MENLTIIPAGAGSGKTHRIQEELTQRIREGVAPEKIVAVTFTEAAAAELRGRIRSALVEKGLLDKALRLDQAYISTIHGFGLRVLSEFVFEGGFSPTLRMLSDDEQSMLVSRSLARSESAARMMQRLSRYGYAPDISNSKSAEQIFRETLLKFISTLRSIGRDSGGGQLSCGIERQIRSLYGETRLVEHLKGRLLEAVKSLLLQFPAGVAELSNVKESVRDNLRKESIALKRAEKGYPLDTDWHLWKQLANLKTYKNPTKYFPAGYQELAEEVIAAAECLPQHPGPLQDALEHAGLLLGAAADCLGAYSSDKRERGLIDFTDMVALSRQLLCLNATVIESMKERVSCLVIDEFQDTNPLQFSLLWALTRQGIPTIIVGDLKQAIMGFQGADPRLLQELCNQNPGNTSPLTKNWRTTERLMEVINHFGNGLFGSDYTALEPTAKFSSRLPSPLELLVADKSLDNDIWASHLVGRLHRLLSDPENEVFDKKTEKYRKLRGSDIAILCPNSLSRMKAYAVALRAAGIPCRMQQDGWFQSRTVQLAIHALFYVADPGDLHARLYLSVTEFGSLTLQEALKTLIGKGDIRDPALHGKLENLAAEAGALQIDEVLSLLIMELDFYGRISMWEDALQARADLLRLQEECLEFRKANRETLACSGYFGSGIKTFLAWLGERVKRDGNKPEPSVMDEGAVQLVTWHSSKGREWPVVAVCGMDADFTPRLPSTRVEYDDFADLGAILEKVRVEMLPSFECSDTNQKFIGSLLEDADKSATRLLYVALTRAREKLILEWPAYQDATRTTRKNKTYWDLFTERTGALISEGKLLCCNESLDFYRIAADTDPWVTTAQFPSKRLSPVGRRAVAQNQKPSNLVAEAIIPSSQHGSKCDSIPRPIDSGYAKDLKLDLPSVQDEMEKGKILHRAFEILSGHPERTHLLSDAVGHQLEEEQIASICAVVAAFDAWVADNLKPVSVAVEVPLLALNDVGSVVHGFADMIVETADGYWIIDHKSDNAGTPEKREERFKQYYPQLLCYAESIKKIRSGKPVKGIAINWVSFGLISLVNG